LKTLLAATMLAAFALVAIPAAAASAGTGGSGGVCFDCDPPKPPAGEPEPTDGVLTLRQLRQLTRDVGFAKPRLAAAIAMAESSGDTQAVGHNRKPRSTDRGLFQINSRWHFEVSDRCAFDARCNAEAALRISEGGRDWHQWSTWHNGAYKAYL
jgi:hypothetical protein